MRRVAAVGIARFIAPHRGCCDADVLTREAALPPKDAMASRTADAKQQTLCALANPRILSLRRWADVIYYIEQREVFERTTVCLCDSSPRSMPGQPAP
jgi:hypothetical protein